MENSIQEQNWIEVTVLTKYKPVKILIDIEDQHIIRKHIWTLLEGKYLRTNHSRNNKFLHRLIMKAEKGQMVDHINQNTFDNRKSNLRFTNYQENSWNQKRTKKTYFGVNPSKYIGVHWHKTTYTQKWQARINNKFGRRISLGHFDNEEDAARAYDKAAKEIRGDQATLNFPEEKDVSNKS